MAALGRCLVSRGHEVTVFHLLIAKAAVQAAGLQFCPIDQYDVQSISHGVNESPASRFKFAPTVNAITAHAEQLLREGCAALRAARVDMVIADQMDVAAGSIAEYVGVPFINVGCGPPVYFDESVPAPYFGWHHSHGFCARLRNALGNSLIGLILHPVLRLINDRRRSWGLREIRHLNDLFSKSAIITQLPQVLEFNRARPLPHLFYTGQFVDTWARKTVRFPWDRLNRKPLIYASMGTIRNDLPWVFRAIVTACAFFDVQLVLSLGGGRVRPADLGPLPDDTIVVDYAPQIDLIRRSSLAITCGGLNTTLDCVASGVPMVAIPVAEDQPGIAARIEVARIGKVVPVRTLSAIRLRGAIRNVYRDTIYASTIRRLQSKVNAIDGVGKAAQIIEQTLLSNANNLPTIRGC
jgi:zeaxanthin glucosyltransferase